MRNKGVVVMTFGIQTFTHSCYRGVLLHSFLFSMLNDLLNNRLLIGRMKSPPVDNTVR